MGAGNLPSLPPAKFTKPITHWSVGGGKLAGGVNWRQVYQKIFMDYREKFDAKIEQCLLALSDRIAEFKASGQLGVARELEKQCDEIRSRLNGQH
jgi:hypothetical protein